MLTSSAPLFFAALSFGASVTALPGVIAIARRFGFIDQPAHRKTHSQPVPYLGGMAMVFGILVSCVALLASSAALTAPEAHKVLAILSTGAVAAALGLIDDRFQIRARYKLVAQILVATLFATLCYRFEIMRVPGIDPIDLGPLAIPFTVLWMVTLINGVNLIDGMDGLAGAVGLSIFLMAALNASALHDRSSQFLAVAGAGSMAAFLLFNWAPARVFLGENGSAALGVLVASLLVAMGNLQDVRVLTPDAPLPQETFLFQVPASFVLAAYPFLEVILSVVRRTLRGKSIGSADRAHIHHKLTLAGWNPHAIAIAAAAVTVSAGLVVYSHLAYTRGITAWMLLLTGALVGALLHLCGYQKALNARSIRESRPLFLLANRFVTFQNTRIGISSTPDEVLSIVSQTLTEFGVAQFKLTVQLKAGEGAPQIYEWSRPTLDTGSLLNVKVVSSASGAADHAVLADSKSHAAWSFLSRDIPANLDTEHRILVNDFMRVAIRALEGRASGSPSSKDPSAF